MGVIKGMKGEKIHRMILVSIQNVDKYNATSPLNVGYQSEPNIQTIPNINLNQTFLSANLNTEHLFRSEGSQQNTVNNLQNNFGGFQGYGGAFNMVQSGTQETFGNASNAFSQAFGSQTGTKSVEKKTPTQVVYFESVIIN